MKKKELRFCIVPTVDVSQELVNLSFQTTLNSIRLSNNRNSALFKFDKNDDLARSAFITYKWYTYNEILKVLSNKSTWAKTP